MLPPVDGGVGIAGGAGHTSTLMMCHLPGSKSLRPATSTKYLMPGACSLMLLLVIGREQMASVNEELAFFSGY